MAYARKFVIEMDALPFMFALEFKGDWQLGSRSTCEWKIDDDIEETLNRAKTMASGVLFLGDIEDEDRPSTRAIRKTISADRSEVAERDAAKHVSYLEADILPRLVRLHEGTKYGIMGGVAGHHWTFLPGGAEVNGKKLYSSVEYMYARLEQITGKPCIYMGQMASFVDLRFRCTEASGVEGKSCRSVGFIQHGEGGGATKSATVTKLERAAQGFDAQWYARGHDCQILGTKTDQLYARDTKGEESEGSIGSRTKTMLNLGAATMGYELGRGNPSYVESGMMRPVTMGWGTKLFRIRTAHYSEDPSCNLKADIKLLF